MNNLGSLPEFFVGAGRDGLNADEAGALLDTGGIVLQTSRAAVFFLVPRQWTDYVLPLRISAFPPRTSTG